MALASAARTVKSGTRRGRAAILWPHLLRLDPARGGRCTPVLRVDHAEPQCRRRLVVGKRAPGRRLLQPAGYVDAGTVQTVEALGHPRGEPVPVSDVLDDETSRDLVAIVWVGRGDYTVEEWDDAVAQAERI